MDLKQLEYFRHVAELGSFTRAASFLSVVQPALSRQVRQLEVELGQNLFERNGRGVALTDAGTRLLEHTRGILLQVGRARQELEDQKNGDSGHFVLGLPPSLGRSVTVPLVKAFGRLLAMHISFSNPLAIDPTGLDAATVEREKGVLAAKAEGKPANVVEKIVESGLKSYYKEVCLLEQAFIHDEKNKQSVALAIKEAEAKVGAPIKVTGFVRFGLGEGIDRPSGDFGGEVAALAGTH